MATRQLLDENLEKLYKLVVRLGNDVNDQIKDAIKSLSMQDLELAKNVITGDITINELQCQIEHKCILLMATQQPFATDLRKVVAAFKISIYLERMGDLAVDIAKITIRIGDNKLIKPLIDLPRMADIVCEMNLKGLEACKNGDLPAALDMAEMDDYVDELYNQIFRELLVFMMEDPKTIDQATRLLFAGRFLERIGDYCTNIAEEVEYVVTGNRSDLNM